MNTRVRNNRYRKPITVIIALTTIAGAQNASFPGTKSEVRSPNGKYVIRNIDNEHRDPAHALVLVDSASGKQEKLYEYGRHVDVSWSPNARALVINDFEGSDYAHPLLFVLPKEQNGIDLGKTFADFLTSEGKARVLKNHHVYLTAEKWLGDSELLCKVTGYGENNPHGFTNRYTYTIGEGFRLADGKQRK